MSRTIDPWPRAAARMETATIRLPSPPSGDDRRRASAFPGQRIRPELESDRLAGGPFRMLQADDPSYRFRSALLPGFSSLAPQVAYDGKELFLRT